MCRFPIIATGLTLLRFFDAPLRLLSHFFHVNY